MVRVLQRRPSNAIDVWDDGYLRALSQRLVLVEVKDFGRIDGPDIRCTICSGEASSATRLAASAAEAAGPRHRSGASATPRGK
jgi:hypothetical protein